MAKARVSSPQSTLGPRRSMLMKTIITFLIVVVVMVGLTILVIWLSIKPKKPDYFIVDGSIHDYNLSNDHHLSASYNLTLKSVNPSKKMSLQYKKMEIRVMFENETIASGVINPWHQHKKEKRLFNLDLASRDVELSGAVSQHLELAKMGDQVVLDVELKSRIRAKYGIWKSRYYHIKVSCAHVVVYFSNSSKGYWGCRTFL